MLRGITADGKVLVADPSSLKRSNQEWGVVPHFGGSEKAGRSRRTILGYFKRKRRWEKMILYLSSQQHTNLLDFLAEKEDALPIKKNDGKFYVEAVCYLRYAEFFTLHGAGVRPHCLWG